MAKDNDFLPFVILFIVIIGVFQYYKPPRIDDVVDVPRINSSNLTTRVSDVGGRGARIEVYSNIINMPITNVSICMYEENPCRNNYIDENTGFYVYWNVENGVGCCNTFHCNYVVFSFYCLEPDFKLYNAIYDGVPLNVTGYGYEYSCSHDVPWNRLKINNVSEGTHTLVIEQKDCVKVVDTETIRFNLDRIGSTSMFVMEMR
jgi:hypothetical protein